MKTKVEEVTKKICQRCQAWCCQEMWVTIEEEFDCVRRYKMITRMSEYKVGLYLKRDKNGYCVYFDKELKKCKIYKRRPAACKLFFCGKGTKYNCMWERIKEAHKKRVIKEKKEKFMDLTRTSIKRRNYK